VPFAPGARFGAFEILARLGAGGMGEVYRARDTRLDRTVALKFLSSSEVRRQDRLDRFKREARAISRLNHPHICGLYDIGEQDGEAFLVMEYVPGETLADRLARGPLRLEQVLRCGVEIAEALDAAHREGVVHRDLKPGNIMLARGGAKLLDFGLAKLRSGENDHSEAQTTISVPLSEDGVVIGTLPYMAPEQLEGKEADARTDIFAAGAVLYEMTTGEPPFRGSSRASLIAAILSQEPKPLTARQPLTPPALEHAIRRCLAKHPDDRWQNARDLAAELRWIADIFHQSMPTPKVVRRSRRSIAIVSGTTAVAVLGWLAAALPAFRHPSLPVPAFHHLTFRRGIVTAARFAPDGQTIVYSAAWDGGPYELFLTRQGSTESRPLGIGNSRLLGISSSGDMALLLGPQTVSRAFGMLARVPLAGGVPRDVLNNVIAADWSPDGSELAVVRTVPGSPGKLRVEFPIGVRLFESDSRLPSIRISPSGDRLALVEGDTVVVVDRGGRKTILSSGWVALQGVAWSVDGNEVWFTSTRGNVAPTLHAVSLSGRERSLVGATDPLMIHDVFRDGRVLVARHTSREGFACRAPGAASDRDLSWFDGSSLEALSADGRTAVFGEVRGGGGPKSAIYLRRTDGSPAIRLADGYPEDLSPDGKWVLARPTDERRGWVLLPTGAGSPRSLPRGRVTGFFDANWLPDGTGVVFGGSEAGHGGRIYVQDIAGSAPRAVSPEGVQTIGLATPDGRFVEGSAGGTHALYPVNGGEPLVLSFLTPEDFAIQWSADGRFLYVLRERPWPDGAAQVFGSVEAPINRIDAKTGRREIWKTLAPPDRIGLEAINKVLVTPDGRGYCYGYLWTFSSLLTVDGLK
jgi:eukaryotic-like serine/threonine-protein kinase